MASHYRKEAAIDEGIGAPLPRLEDERFLTGRGRFVDDFRPEGMLYAAVVRSPHAHARLGRIERRPAPGVVAVYTGEEARSLGRLPCLAIPPQARMPASLPTQPILAHGKVRYVGEAVALVVAASQAEADDAAEALEVAYEPLPATTLEDALEPGAPRVWDELEDNVGFELERGDAAAVAAAFAGAAHVTRLEAHYPRASANSIEPRAALAIPEGAGATLYTSTQMPFQVRDVLAPALGLEPARLRVVSPDVGGGFGMKSQVYAEEALVLWAALQLGRPVKWTGRRSESLAADLHGRHQVARAELALDAQGRALALRVDVRIDLGAYLGQHAGVAPLNAAISYTNTYDLPLIHARVRACFTHTGIVGPYRGTAKPEATYVVERLMDRAARELGQDPVALRRRNLICPQAMPYRTPGGYLFDSGEFEAVLDRALALSGWEGFAVRRAESRQRGRLRGIGLAMHCQRAGSQGERMALRVLGDGSAEVFAGTMASGQGHETMYAQMVASWLGLPAGRVRLVQGDTARLASGRGTYAQRSMNAGGSALRLAADEVLRKALEGAAARLEASAADIEFSAGEFRIRGTDRRISLAALAGEAGLEGAGEHPGPNNFPNGCMVAEVEVDPETGEAGVLALTAVDDAGRVVNPLTLEGQLHGSIAQGLGPCFAEQLVYERGSAQLLTGSFMDYAMPRAADMPPVRAALHPVPTRTNLLGVKGGAEAGNVGVPPAVVHALLDALRERGVDDVPLPATPLALWRLLSRATPRPV